MKYFSFFTYYLHLFIPNKINRKRILLKDETNALFIVASPLSIHFLFTVLYMTISHGPFITFLFVYSAIASLTTTIAVVLDNRELEHDKLQSMRRIHNENVDELRRDSSYKNVRTVYDVEQIWKKKMSDLEKEYQRRLIEVENIWKERLDQEQRKASTQFSFPSNILECFQILGMDATTDPDTIKKAYRSMVKVYHPDKGGSDEMFNAIQFAYESICQHLGIRR